MFFVQNNTFKNNEDVNHQSICKRIHNDMIRIHDTIIIHIYMVKIYVEIITYNIITSYYKSLRMIKTTIELFPVLFRYLWIPTTFKKVW